MEYTCFEPTKCFPFANNMGIPLIHSIIIYGIYGDIGNKACLYAIRHTICDVGKSSEASIALSSHLSERPLNVKNLMVRKDKFYCILYCNHSQGNR